MVIRKARGVVAFHASRRVDWGENSRGGRLELFADSQVDLGIFQRPLVPGLEL